MKEVMIKNISKISFLDNKMQTIYNLIESKKYKEAYKATAAVIELVSAILLEKVYNVQVENSNIINLIMLLKNREDKIEKILTEVNGEYNQKNYEYANQINVEFLVGYLDEIIKVILDEHGDIFKE